MWPRVAVYGSVRILFNTPAMQVAAFGAATLGERAACCPPVGPGSPAELDTPAQLGKPRALLWLALGVGFDLERQQ
jgi:hypothetical protein